jgi:hypothetical protein
MSDPTERERALLHDMRLVLSPTRSDRDRLGARIAASVASGAMPSYETDAPTGGASEGIVSQGVQGLGAQVAAAALVAVTGFGAGYFTGRSAPSESPTDLVVAPPVHTPEPSPAARPQSQEAASEKTESIASLSSVPKGSPPSASASKPTPSAQTLSEEARELQRVDRALRNGNPSLALGLLTELDERVPRGVLLEERAAARLIARCLNGDADAAIAAVTWLERHPASVYAPRLRAACESKSPRE